MRHDYRNDYRGWSIERIRSHIPTLQYKLLKNLLFCKSNADNYLKRISYLENKIENARVEKKELK